MSAQTPTPPPSTLSSRRSSTASSASVLSGITKKPTTDPELLLLQQRSRKWYVAHREQHWSAVSRWEQTRMQEEGVPVSATRGDAVDDWVSDLIAICAAAGFKIDNEQTLRDAVFDYVRSVSYR